MRERPADRRASALGLGVTREDREQERRTVERRAEEGYVGPIADVHWGEGTQDEMCIGYLTVVD